MLTILKPVMAVYCNFWMSATVSLVCLITTFSLPAQRSFFSFQHGSPGQTLILLCQREKEGRRAGSPGYLLTLRDAFNSASCTPVSLHKPEEIRLPTDLFKGMFSRSKDLKKKVFHYTKFFILFGWFLAHFVAVTPHEPHLHRSCHLTLALKAEEGCYKPSYPDGMRMSKHLEWTEIADGGGGMTSCVRKVMVPLLASVSGRTRIPAV